MKAMEIRLQRMQRILEISRELASTVSLAHLLDKIVQAAAELTDSEMAAILLLDESKNELHFAAASVLPDQFANIPVPIDGSIAGFVLTSAESLIVSDARQDPRHYKGVDQTLGFETHSLLAAPLLVKERAIGVVEAENKRDGAAFDENDVETLTALATQAAVAIENARLVEALQQSRDVLEKRVQERTDEIHQRTIQLEALRELSLDLAAQLDLGTLLQSIVSRAINLLSGSSGGLYLYDSEQDLLEWAVAIGSNVASPGLVLRRGEGLAGKVWVAGEPFVVDDYHRWEGRAPAWKDYRIGAIIGIPICWADTFLGVLNVWADGPGVFSQGDVDLLSMFATQAAIAIRNARLYEQSQVEIAERLRIEQELKDHRSRLEELVNERTLELSQVNQKLEQEIIERVQVEAERERSLEAEREQRKLAEALRQASATLSGTLDYGEVLERILDQISQLVPKAAVNIMLLEGEMAEEDIETMAQVLRGRGYEQFGVAATAMTIHFKLGEAPILYRMQQNKQPVVISDVAHCKEWVNLRPEHDWINSYLGVPIIMRDKVIGFLNANSAIVGFFDQSDVGRLRAFADHAGIAIQNARLYDQIQRELAERERVEQELLEHQDHLEDMVQDRASELVMAIAQLEDEIFERTQAETELQRSNQELGALNSIGQALSASLDLNETLTRAISCLVEALGFAGGLVALVSRRKGGELAFVCHANLPQPLVEYLQSSMCGDLCGFVYQKALPVYLADLEHEAPVNVQTLLEAGFQAYVGAPITYQERVLGMFCLVDTKTHLVPNINDSLLLAIGRQMGVAVENVRLFRDVVRERQASYTLLDTAKALSTTLRLDVLLERVLDELGRIVPYDAVSISMLHDERCWTVASRGLDAARSGRFELDERPLVKRVVHERQPVIVPDVAKESDWVVFKGIELVCSWLGVPLIAKDKVIGVLLIDSHACDAHDEEAARLASAFAHQVALAIENSRLYEQVQAKLREVTLLHSVTAALSFTLDLDRILPYVARSLCEILNATSVEIYDLEADETITRVANYVSPAGSEQERGVVLGQVHNLADLASIARILDKRRPVQVQVGDFYLDPLFEAELADYAAKAMLILPMVSGNRVLGFARVWESQVQRHFTDGEITTGQALIHQAAIAVYNARLVNALRQYTAELETQNAELDAFAHTVAHDLKNPLTALIGYSNLLEKRFTKMSAERVLQNLHTIWQGGVKMQSIIDELLLLASVRKVEDVQRTSLDMTKIVAEAQMRLINLNDEYQAEYVLPAEDEWPKALGYAPWIEEVWVNYISNAIKYGGVRPCVELGATQQKDGVVRFWVRDNGPGLSPEAQSRLFTPFARLHQVYAKGHGLGLSIVQRIVEKLGGQVGVESTAVAGEGSTFFFTLPTVPEQ